MKRELLTLSEAARYVRISDRTLRAHISDGDIRYIAIGKGAKRTKKLFDPADLDAFIEGQKRWGSSPRRFTGPKPGTPSVTSPPPKARAPRGTQAREEGVKQNSRMKSAAPRSQRNWIKADTEP